MNVGGQLGKLAFAKALGAIDAKHERFIKALSGIRNDCVHDVRNVNFQFDGYVDGLPQDARQTFLAGFADLLLDPIPFQGKEVPRDDFVRQNTRISLWAAGCRLSRSYTRRRWTSCVAKAVLPPYCWTRNVKRVQPQAEETRRNLKLGRPKMAARGRAPREV